MALGSVIVVLLTVIEVGLIIETGFIGQKGTQYIPGFSWIIRVPVFFELTMVINFFCKIFHLC